MNLRDDPALKIFDVGGLHVFVISKDLLNGTGLFNYIIHTTWLSKPNFNMQEEMQAELAS